MSDLRAKDGTPTWACEICGVVRRRFEFDEVIVDGESLRICTDAEGCDRIVASRVGRGRSGVAGPVHSGALRVEKGQLLTDTTRTVVVMLDGEFDIARTAELRDTILLARTDEPEVFVDMSNVTFIDSSALRALLEVRRVLAEQGAVLVISDPSPCVRRVLSATATSAIFGVAD
jgi:anti-anti-sigma factor